MNRNADLYVSLQSKPATIQVGQAAIIEAITGNCGNDSVVADSIRLVVSGPNNAEIIGIHENSDPRWSIKHLDTGTSNTIVLVNDKGGFGPFDLGAVLIKVKGSIEGPASVVSSNVGYITDHNADLQGALNASQGNMSSTNDNSTTSITVVAGRVWTIKDYMAHAGKMFKYVGEITTQVKDGAIYKRTDFILSKGKIRLK